MKKIFLLTLALLASFSLWAANGDVLFTQDFSGTGSLTYTQNVGLTKTSGLAGIVGDADNLFTSVTTNNKNTTGIAINHATGGNSKSAVGIFQAYFNNTSGYWSAIRTNDFAGDAPTALKLSMDIYFDNLSSSSSAVLANIAIGNGFTESLKSSSPEDASTVHSGWGITVESSPKLCAYNTYGTKIYNTALSYSTWYSITWIVNNTGETLTYDNPTGSGTSTIANDKYDIWLKTQAQGIASYTKVASAISATTEATDLQELYFGSPSGKKHEFRMDNIVVTDLTPAPAGPVDPTITFNNANYNIGGSLDLSTLFSSNSKGDVTYSVKNANGTGATIAGTSFSASTTGTAIVTASQAAETGKYNAKSVDATITVLAPPSAEPTISAHPSTSAAQYIKDATATALSVTASGNGTVTYQWYSNTTASNTDGTILENCTTETCTPSTASLGTLYYYCAVTNTETSKTPTTINSNVSGAITVVAPSHDITYTNLKGADNSANPTTYAEGTGVASFAKLRHVIGYDFKEWSPSSISTSATTDQTIEAQWTENAVATGAGSLTYAFAFGSGTVTTSSITRVNGSLYDATDVSLAHTSFDDNAAKNGCSGKLNTTSSKSETNYVELTFKIADGYTFMPSSVSVRANAVSTDKTIEVELKDNAATPNSKSVTATLTAGSTDKGATNAFNFADGSPVKLEGTVTLKIYVYGATNAWRLGTSIVISGTVAEKTYAVTFADPSNGTLVVKNGEDAITSGDKFPQGTTLDVVATPTDNDYALAALTAGETDILSNKQFTVGTEDIEVSATFTEKPAAQISWTSATASIALNGDAATLQALTNGSSLPVAYSSSNTGVASIDAETGAITLEAEGIANITATYTSTAEGAYKTTEVSYGLTVTAATYAVTFDTPSNGTLVVKKQVDEEWVAIASGDKFIEGTTLKVEATPASGYELNTLLANSTDIKESKSFTIGTVAVVVSATFKAEGGGTGFDNTADEIKAVKFFENGKLFIRRGDKVFDAQGQLVK